MARINLNDIQRLQISLASPEQILKWARGTEVTKSETINYKTFKPEPDGLFCEKIFGPEKNFECACGKYKKVKYRGKVCEKCGVEIIESIVRRERMSCIKLNYPCTHIWMAKELPNPSKIALLLNMSYKEVEQIIYFVNSVVLKNDSKEFASFYHAKQIIPIAADLKTNQEARTKIANVLSKIKDMISASLKHTHSNSKKAIELSQDLEEISQYVEAIRNQNLVFETKYIFGLIEKYSGIKIGTGSLAIKQLLQEINLSKESRDITNALKKTTPSSLQFKRLMSRLEVVKWFINSHIKPEWMVFDVIPVTPPDTRPIVKLENGRFTASDINTFYRKLIIRNQRLKRLMDDRTPEIMLDNERRMLQESVDALFDNASRSKPSVSKDHRPLKSLTDHLKGKQGLFRQNLLGKRVDFSGRSVIVVGPELKMYQVGLPAIMAIQLFKPYIIHELITRYDENGIEKQPIASNIKQAEKLILQQHDVIFQILEKVVKQHPVLLNRAPTLHRLSVQAFEPKIVDGKAIRLHPLVTTAFNADFDGDQMGVYVPLSKEAIAEARSILLASWHILGPKDGKPVVTPTQDMILGVFYISKCVRKQQGEGTIFATVQEAIKAYELKQVNLHAIVGISTNNYLDKGLPSNHILLTTVGKIIFNSIFPTSMPYMNNASDIGNVPKTHLVPMGQNVHEWIKKITISLPYSKKTLQNIVNILYKKFPIEVVAKTMDAIKDIGFEYSTKSSITISAFDLPIYHDKVNYFKDADDKVVSLKRQFEKGLLTDDERYTKVVSLWAKVKDHVTNDIDKIMHDEKYQDNSVVIMANSGARGNVSQFTQLLGMRGLMSKSYNYDQKTKSNVVKDTIETPIKHNFLEGLTVSEYFNSSYGARKGMADTAMKTSKSGYMTRKLVDAAQEIIVKEEDCHTTKGLLVEAIVDAKQNSKVESLWERIANRYAFANIINPKDGKILVKKDEIITVEMAQKIENLGIKQVLVRSVLHCKCTNGVCQKCFGNDLATNKPIAIGSAIGVVAAQSIGEPGTQLTMRTFHTGGAAGESNIAQGFERLKQLFDMVPPRENEVAVIAKISGKVSKIEWTESGPIIYVKNSKTNEELAHVVNSLRAVLRVEKNEEVNAGDKLTEGAINMKQLLQISGIAKVRDYLIKEVQKVYRIQGIEISDKYIEIIIRQLTNKLKISYPGDSRFFIGEVVEENIFANEINQMLKNKKNVNLPTATNIIFGLDNVATTKSGSFLAAASFQDTKKILTDAAVKAEYDNLTGLKENVMLGKLLPIGTSLMSSEEIIKLGNEMYKKEY